MPQTTINGKTWACPECGYKQDTDPTNPYQQSPTMFPNVPLGSCPSCYGTKGDFQMSVTLDPNEFFTYTVKAPEDVEAATVPLFDNGAPVMVDSGEVKQELAIVDGKPAVVETPVLVQDVRPLTQEEAAAELEKINIALDTHSAMEFDPNQVG